MGIFYLAYREWLGWLLLAALLCLPVLSLLLSLPGMLTLKLRIVCPAAVPMGEAVAVNVAGRCWFPMPVFRCRIHITRTLTAEQYCLRLGDFLPTEHCGTLICQVKKGWVYDYLGLFRISVGEVPVRKMVVRPEEIPVQMDVSAQQRQVVWKPKPGGGFAENHELRLYRPGDQLNQIHWKLTAKTGKPIIREPMIPAGRRPMVSLCLTGTAGQLDEKFGRLLGACRQLLMNNVSHEIGAVTGTGIQILPIAGEQELMQALDKLLGCSGAEQEQDIPQSGVWTYRIGGDGHG